jgi:hypothetical protein
MLQTGGYQFVYVLDVASHKITVVSITGGLHAVG